VIIWDPLYAEPFHFCDGCGRSADEVELRQLYAWNDHYDGELYCRECADEIGEGWVFDE